jgi:uncharacterized membrane protein YgaE (UPF0421/DUF939 family)
LAPNTEQAGKNPWDSIRRTVAPSVRPARLLLALKTAIAAGLAWPVAQLLPGTVDEYSYYAPLGALLSMMPTLMGSLRTTLQTVIGLLVGVALAWAVLESPLPGLISVPLAVGFGVIFGGLRGLGSGRDYVPIAALFVLVVGGGQADDYSYGYVIQMGVGLAIGFIVNLSIAPPLRFRESTAEISALRSEIAQNLEGMSEALVEDWPPEDQEWFEGVKSLRDSIKAAEPIIEEAGESRRINPRAHWQKHDVQQDFDDLDALSVLARHTLELGEAISAAIWSDPVPVRLSQDLREPLSAVLARMAELVRAWNDREDAEAAARAAEASIERLADKDRDVPPSEPANQVLGSTIFTARRMLAVIRARTDPPQA